MMGKKTAIEEAPEMQTDLYCAIEGTQANVSLVLANHYPLPGDAEEIDSCIIEVTSFPDRTEWAPILPIPLWVQSITRLAAGFLLSSGDALIRVINDKVEELPPLPGYDVTSIWERGRNDYWIFHSAGLVHWDGTRTFSGATELGRIVAMHALGPNFAIAVGEAGVVLAFDGKRWNKIDGVPTKKFLNGVLCVAPDEIYISGWQGALYKWDGEAEWQKIKYTGDIAGGEMYGGSLACYRGTVYLCGGTYGLYRIIGKKAEPLETFYASRAMVVHDKLIVTGESMWNEFDGNEWIQVDMTL